MGKSNYIELIEKRLDVIEKCCEVIVAQNKIMREALKFYSDCFNSEDDFGKHARQALEKCKEIEHG